MPRLIRRLGPEQEFADFSAAYVNAYPAVKMPPDQLAQRFVAMSADTENHYWGVFEAERFAGGFILYDFNLNYLGRFIKAGGVGGVWVDLLQKKRGIAKEIITHFLDHYEQSGASLALLYPFRPDFYRQMGFGFGPKQEHYLFTPGSLPGDRTPHGLTYLTDEDRPLIEACRNAYAATQHGEPLMHATEVVGMLRGFAPRHHLIGLKDGDVLRGYMSFSFKNYDNNFVKNDLVIHEWVCDGPATRQRFCNFLRSQADQINRIQYDTQDPAFHYLLNDVRNGTDNMIPSVYHESATIGVGLMYRIINLRAFFAATAHRNYGGVTADVTLRVTDSFRPVNDGVHQLSFRDGELTVTDGAAPTGAMTLSLDIAELSALLMGATDVASLCRNLRVEADPAHVSLLTQLFATERPNCIRAF